MNKEKTIKSYWGVDLKSEVIDQNSSTLVVLIPGIGYTLDRPLMDYSKKLVLELGYNVLRIEYGFQITRKSLNPQEEFKYIKKESMDIFKCALNGNYKKIIFISKSIGTIIHTILCNEVNDYEVKNIYLTPVNETVKVGIKENSLVISGTNDPLISKETVEEIREIQGVNIIEVKNGDHSLNIKCDILKSIEVLYKVIEAEKEYLNK